MTSGVPNLYVHFPFCRRKCSYCALHSGVCRSATTRAAHVQSLVERISAPDFAGAETFATVYFGGGSPALCNLSPLFDALAHRLDTATEFTVELHPLDVTDDLLAILADGGVNRISMGVQSLDDTTLAHMGRGYTIREAENAFRLIRRRFNNCGIDLIVGYPKLTDEKGSPVPEQRNCFNREDLQRLADWGISHCSVYSLILEEKSLLSHELNCQPTRNHQGLSPQRHQNQGGLSPSKNQNRGGLSPSGVEKQGGLSPEKPWGLSPGKSWGLSPKSDDETLAELDRVAEFLDTIGLKRYEISNYALPGRECRHNLAVWRGEDYLGLGDGAFGRVGLTRTEATANGTLATTVSETENRKERAIFRLRTKDGIDASLYPEWLEILSRFEREGLTKRPNPKDPVFVLTHRGTEVCDAILAELV